MVKLAELGELGESSEKKSGKDSEVGTVCLGPQREKATKTGLTKLIKSFGFLQHSRVFM